MNLGFIGMGFVGGATAQVFGKKHEIYPYDKYKRPYSSQRNLYNLVVNADVVFVSVPTPMQKSGAIDLSAVEDAFSAVRDRAYDVLREHESFMMVVRSTVVPGTCDALAKKYNFHIASNPEFVREKYAVEDMKNTKRVILGVTPEVDSKILLNVYKPVFPRAKYFISTRKEAEMIKYMANVMLIGQVSMANELYQICKKANVDYDGLKEIILNDERIGRNIDVPGHDGDFGFGGKCFPKDLQALTYFARQIGYEPKLLEEIWDSNLKIRKNHDWNNIPGATSENKNFSRQ